jgi:hypothetical protein
MNYQSLLAAITWILMFGIIANVSTGCSDCESKGNQCFQHNLDERKVCPSIEEEAHRLLRGMMATKSTFRLLIPT